MGHLFQMLGKLSFCPFGMFPFELLPRHEAITNCGCENAGALRQFFGFREHQRTNGATLENRGQGGIRCGDTGCSSCLGSSFYFCLFRFIFSHHPSTSSSQSQSCKNETPPWKDPLKRHKTVFEQNCGQQKNMTNGHHKTTTN